LNCARSEEPIEGPAKTAGAFLFSGRVGTRNRTSKEKMSLTPDPQIAADFAGGLPTPFRFTAYQLSTVFGRGPGKTASFYFS
jgi:hypothetical protein